MKCPFCGHLEHKVLDTRVQKDSEIKRRRECLECKGRFSTVEGILKNYPHILKKDGRREPFNKDKLRKGIELACLKRTISLAQIDGIVSRITKKVLEKNEKEISTQHLGKDVMDELKHLDDVAYVRFASVYKTFKDVHEFVSTLAVIDLDKVADLDKKL